MATYTSALTLPDTVSKPLIPGLRILRGSVNINPYSQTRAGFKTGIAAGFENQAPTVVVALSDQGYTAVYDVTNDNFKVFGTNGAATNPLAEAAEGANVGNFQFIALGY